MIIIIDKMTDFTLTFILMSTGVILTFSTHTKKCFYSGTTLEYFCLQFYILTLFKYIYYYYYILYHVFDYLKSCRQNLPTSDYIPPTAFFQFIGIVGKKRGFAYQIIVKKWLFGGL